MSNPSKPNSILALDPEHLRELDGVVLDADSYARHAPPRLAAPPAPAAFPAVPPAPAAQNAEAGPAGPGPVFAAEPQHVGWYQTNGQTAAYPVMAGAVPPGQTVVYGTGSGSYVSSYYTSFWTSYWTSYWFGSGSWVTEYFLRSFGGSFAGPGAGSAWGMALGGYGLELI